MEQEKSDQRLEESEKDMKRAPLPTGDAMASTGPGNDQRVFPALTKEFVRMMESSQDGKVDLKAASQELKAPRSTVDHISSILEGIQFLKRISSDVVQMIRSSDHHKLTERLEKAWKEQSTLDGQLESLRVNTPEGEQGDKKPAETNETPKRPLSGSTKEEPEMIGKRTLLSPYPTKSSSNTSPSSTSYPRPASRRRTTPVYIFGQSTPFKKQFTPADRLVQVSSEDTDESIPSSKSEASNFSSPESLPHPLSPAATVRNARSRVLLLANSPDHDPAASSSGSTTTTTTTTTTPKKSSMKPTPSAAAAAAVATRKAPKSSTRKDYDFSKKRVPSFVSKPSSGDEVIKRPKKKSG
ncbi:unnamed protein product [Cylindrotheca closterium]|uniref:Uncharacterized protein n=1 Tax=Cylindrotheca closterium TaxID=2856 RepID=A0AAD2G5M8_9STRA|nr:unnamed protein product [Cylindrotheca closterium]